MKLALLGATGATGRLVLKRALADGHEVRALVRDPAKLPPAAGLEVIAGDATAADDVAKLVAGCDAVISALGPTSGGTEVVSRAAEHVVAAGVRRYVAVSGAGIDVPGDEKDLFGRIVSFFVRTLSPAMFRDKVREHEILAASAVGWTLVRPPRLLDGPGTGQPKSSLVNAPGTSIDRADLAAFVLRAVTDDALIGKAPFVAG